MIRHFTASHYRQRDGKEIDSMTTPAASAPSASIAEKGFFLNGQPLKIHGVCEHQDHAGVGVAVPDSLFEFRIRKLKEMGVNAIRCAHNPPDAEFLEACDRLGMMVLDENRNFNSTPEYIRQLQWMVRRDRNHPSVIIWSVFNEEPMQGTEAGYEMVRRMSAAVKALDTSRPVTAAMSGGILQQHQCIGCRGPGGVQLPAGQLRQISQAHPDKPMTSSEDTSAFMTRGENVADDKAAHPIPMTTTARLGARRTATAGRPSRAAFCRRQFYLDRLRLSRRADALQMASVSSYFGCMDLCGFPKAAFYIHQAQWVLDRPIVTLIPHWNWAGREGQPIKVMALSNADAVELSLNGKVISEQPVDKYTMVSWDVPYAPGQLEAVAKKGGREISRASVEKPVNPCLPTHPGPPRDGRRWQDAQPVTVQVLDKEGRLVPTANQMVEFEIAGPGTVIGLGNGDPNCHEPEKGNRHSLFNGLAQIIVQTQPDGGSGPLTLRARAPGLETAEATIKVAAAKEHPFVPVPQTRKSVDLQKWRIVSSDCHTARPKSGNSRERSK